MAAAAVVGAFTSVWLALGLLSDGYEIFGVVVPTYSPIHQPISGLGLGPTAAGMNTAFVLYGLLFLIGAPVAGRRLARLDARSGTLAMVAIGLHGAGAVLCGLFTLESMTLHSLGFLLILAPILGFGLIGRRLSAHTPLRRWGRVLLWVAAPVGAALTLGFFMSFDPVAAGNGIGLAGLTQRALVVHLQVWLCVLTWLAGRPTTVASRATA